MKKTQLMALVLLLAVAAACSKKSSGKGGGGAAPQTEAPPPPIQGVAGDYSGTWDLYHNQASWCTHPEGGEPGRGYKRIGSTTINADGTFIVGGHGISGTVDFAAGVVNFTTNDASCSGGGRGGCAGPDYCSGEFYSSDSSQASAGWELRRIQPVQ